MIILLSSKQIKVFYIEKEAASVVSRRDIFILTFHLIFL